MATTNNINTDLKILYWNARSIKPRKEELPKMLEKIDLFVCVESWLDSDENCNVSGFQTFRKDRTDSRGGGILILVRNNLAFHELRDFVCTEEDFEVTALRINNVQPTVDIFACYRPPHTTPTQKTWNEIFEKVKRSKSAILVGDFNAHHKTWNCEKNDTAGDRLLESLNNSNLILHNPNTKTYLQPRSNKKSNLDLIFTSTNIADKATVKVDEDTHGSDHFPIFINFQITKSIYRKKSFKLNSIRTNWGQIYKDLEKQYCQFMRSEYDSLAASEKYEFFVNNVLDTIIANTPKKRTFNNKNHRNPVPWWDLECDKVKRLRKAALKKFQYTNSENDFINYKKSAAMAVKTFKKKKGSILEISLKA